MALLFEFRMSRVYRDLPSWLERQRMDMQTKHEGLVVTDACNNVPSSRDLGDIVAYTTHYMHIGFCCV